MKAPVAAWNADRPEDRRSVFRIGIDLGDAIVAGGDIFGDGVNVAARPKGLAEPGGSGISGIVQRILHIDSHNLGNGFTVFP